VELLVVIAIISIILAMAVAGTFQVVDSQRAGNTETTLRTVDKVLRSHAEKVLKDAKNETPSPAAYYLAGGDGRRAQVIWAKLRLMEAFPQSYAEVQGYGGSALVYSTPTNFPGPLIPSGQRRYMVTYQGKLKGRASTDSSTESAALLLIALTEIDRGNLKLTAQNVNPVDTDGDGLPEIVDGWGKAILFIRFPTANTDLQAWYQQSVAANSKQSVNCDPLDPDGTLLNPNWQGQATFAQLIHPVSPNGSAPSYFTTPVLVSAGRNGNFGVDPNTMAVTDANAANDNVYSYLLK
jgi:type II secretory pathway pseudopilin PulG